MDLIAHIGYPKTASTYLQKHVFTAHPEIHLLPNQKILTALRSVKFYDDSQYSKENVYKKIAEQFEENKRIQLVSHEPLTGIFLKYHYINRSIIARRLYELGVRKIIISIRNQTDLLESAYKQFIKSGGTLPWKEFYTFRSPGNNRYTDLSYFNFYQMSKLYAELFGKENIHIMAFEDLVNKSEMELERMRNFLDLKQGFDQIAKAVTNPSLSFGSTRILRISNHFTYSSYKPSQLFSKRISTNLIFRILQKYVEPVISSSARFYNTSERDYVRNFYKENNLKLQQEYEIDLPEEYF